MSNIRFGQNFEDVPLWRALSDVGQGRYLDIGAQHPIIDSVSRSFYLAGWRGVHVEPVPFFAEALREDRPDEIVIEAAVGGGSGKLTLYAITGTGLSTADWHFAEAHGLAGHEIEPIEVDQVSLDTLLDLFANEELHWLKIDVEGMEAEVLASWGVSRVRPWVVVIETIDPIKGTRTDGQWRSILEQRGYHEVLFDGLNCFFVADEHKALCARLGSPANCRDDYVAPLHHWVVAAAVDQCRSEVVASNAAAAAARVESARTYATLASAFKDRDRAERKNNYLSKQLEELHSERSVLNAALGQLGEELAARRGDLSRLEGRLTKAEMRVQFMNRQLNTATEQIISAEHQRDAFTALAAELRNAVTERDASLERLELELRASRLLCDELGELTSRQSGQLMQAEQIAALTLQVSSSWHRFFSAHFSKKGRKRIREMREALRTWPVSLQRFPIINTNPALENEYQVMDVIDYEQRDPSQPANSLDELCSLDDRDFVRCAYVTILGRNADTHGEAFYLGHLRAGDTKCSIVRKLRRSAEGRRFDPGIPRLDRDLRKDRNATIPMFGWLIRLLTQREGNSAVERRLRALSNTLAVEHKLAASRAGAADHFRVTMTHKLEIVEKQLKVAIAAQAMSPRQIAQADGSGDTAWASILTSVLKGN